MRWFVRLLVVILILAGIGLAVAKPIGAYIEERNRPKFTTTKIDRGRIRVTVRTTGRVEPRLKVQIGSFVSGPIEELVADFNDEVEEGELLAKIDPAIYEAALRRDEANVLARRAELNRAKVLLQQAINNEQRGLAIHEEDNDFISDAELDRLRFERQSLEAQVNIAQASVASAEANLENSTANLEYTEIRAPMAGKVIDRKIDDGQTLAAQFQTPELFVIGVDMRKEMYVYASVDEADIGFIRQAQQSEQPVYFRVSAYRDEVFEGRIKEIRMSSTETQTVVTYPVVVTAANPELKLLPGMTANLSFRIEQKDDVIRVPWRAVRFVPATRLVREEDRPLLEGKGRDDEDANGNEEEDEMDLVELVEARKNEVRHVWVKDGDLLRAVEVKLGLSDFRHAEVIEGELEAGQEIVVDLQK